MSSGDADQTELPVDRRGQPRKRLLRRAKMFVGPDRWPVDCTIRDLSDGARLELGSTIGIPDEFDLLILSDRRIAPVRVAWRSDRELGVVVTGQWRPHASQNNLRKR